MAVDPLVAAYTEEGRLFADALRRFLPVILGPDQAKAAAAQAQLQKMSRKVSLNLKATSAVWLAVELPRLVAAGQRRAARQVGVGFGGVNRHLVQRLTQELAPRLATAAESVNPFLSMALRKTSDLKIKRQTAAASDEAFRNIDPQINRSLLRGALEADDLKRSTRRLMANLGLDKGDTILLLSGRRMQASLYARTVTRTRRAEAENQGAAFEYLTQGYQFIETSAHAGVDPDDICYFLQGKVWALVPNDLGIPLLPAIYGLPPWHPNCIHTFGAWIPALNGGQRGIDLVLKRHAKDSRALEEFMAAA